MRPSFWLCDDFGYYDGFAKQRASRQTTERLVG